MSAQTSSALSDSPTVIGPPAAAWWRASARAVQRIEWVLLGAAAPALLFPGRATWLGAALILTTWLARRVGAGRWSVPTRVDRAVLVLCGALLISLLPSVRLDYSTPKFWGLVLGLAAFYAVINTCRTDRSLRLAELALLAAGVGLAILGLVATAAPPDKLIDDAGVYANLPRLITSVQSSTVVIQGINPNELGGVLVLLIPVAFALVGRGGLLRVPALAVGGLMTVAVVLTQSRAALLGLLVCACVGLVVGVGRRGLLLVALLVVVGGQILISAAGIDDLRQRVLGDAQTAGVESLSSRAELWQRGLAMAIDMPITGIGLNTFPVILQTYYPTIVHERAMQLPHVHNMYLQTLLDFGLPGLFAWLFIVVAAVTAGFRAFRGGTHRLLAVGLLLGLLAHGIYSLLDAVTLGAKPGPLVWVVLGLLLVLGRPPVVQAEVAQSATAGPKLRAPRMRLTWVLLAIGLSPVALAFASLNAATLLLHRQLIGGPFLTADLQVAQTLARGPLAPRVDADQALLADLRGDTPAELEAFTRAQSLGNWDPSIGLRLGDLRLATGDRSGALEAWHLAGALPALLDDADTAPLAEAVQWYSLAQATEPTDWRPYAGAARILEAQDPTRALAFLAEAIRLRGDDPVRAAIARRLVDPAAPLPDSATVPASTVDADLLVQASQLMFARQDLPGALLAGQASTFADPRSQQAWLALAAVLDRIGRPAAAAEARARAK